MKTFKEYVAELIARLIHYCVSAFFIMWGWNTLAPYIDAPTFAFLEILAIRMGFTHFMAILWQKPLFEKDK